MIGAVITKRLGVSQIYNVMGLLKESEANIQKAILDWGKVMRIPMRRMNVIGTPTKDGFRPSPNKGMADIHCELIIAGIPVSVWLEVKNKRGKLSVSQETFREGVTSYGGFYFVVRSIEDVEKAFDNILADQRVFKLMNA